MLVVVLSFYMSEMYIEVVRKKLFFTLYLPL
jgi:hypothetical protein